MRRFHVAELQLVLLWEEEERKKRRRKKGRKEEEENSWRGDSHLGKVCGEGGAGNGANLAKPGSSP